MQVDAVGNLDEPSVLVNDIAGLCSKPRGGGWSAPVINASRFPRPSDRESSFVGIWPPNMYSIYHMQCVKQPSLCEHRLELLATL